MIKRPLLGDLKMFQRQSPTVDFIYSNYSFHRMTIDFPVLFPMYCVFHLKVVVFDVYFVKINIFGRISACFCLS